MVNPSKHPEGQVDLAHLEKIAGAGAESTQSTPVVVISTVASPDLAATAAITATTAAWGTLVSKIRSCFKGGCK